MRTHRVLLGAIVPVWVEVTEEVGEWSGVEGKNAQYL